MKPDALYPDIIFHSLKALGSPAELFLDLPPPTPLRYGATRFMLHRELIPGLRVDFGFPSFPLKYISTVFHLYFKGLLQFRKIRTAVCWFKRR